MPKPKRPEGSFRPDALLDYQADAVVSRILASGSRGSVTVFCFDAGQGLDEHSAPFEALIHVLEGEAEVTLEGNPHRLGAGDALLMRPFQPHCVQAVKRFKMLLSLWRE
ncbi:MAG: cupin domain-containing protein [Elusimicrobia bacterium]|nr:cupin domain-containing protein [Elusimicrobiota bacterium]